MITSASGRSSRLPYLPGLDGLRAFAVVGVLLYHALQDRFPGGFLGVEVFFVISGYLITSLLLAERRQGATIDLRHFWGRRARRLLPALYLLLAMTLAFAILFLPGEVAKLRGNALAALFYVANWYLVFHHASYFESIGRPSLFQHLWSLGVEEQFYLLWPLLFIAGMRGLERLRRLAPAQRMRVGYLPLLLAVLTGAAASTIWMASLYRPDADPSRLYYGTDTRAAELLVGCALAFLWSPGQSHGRRLRLPLDAIGLAGLAALTWAYATVNEFEPSLYQGGFLQIALVTAVVIAVVSQPQSRLGRVLGWGPLRWLGLRSYGVYLWHWPVFMVTRPQLDLPFDGLPLLVLRLGLTILLAALSYRFLETPIRSGALGRAWSSWRLGRGPQRRRLALRWATAGSMLLLSLTVLGVWVVQAEPPPPPAYLSVTSVNTAGETSTPLPSASPACGATAAPSAGALVGTAAALPCPTQTPARVASSARAGLTTAAPGTVTPSPSPTPAVPPPTPPSAVSGTPVSAAQPLGATPSLTRAAPAGAAPLTATVTTATRTPTSPAEAFTATLAPRAGIPGQASDPPRGSAASTATLTPTATITATPPVTATATLTATATATSTVTAIATLTANASITPTTTATATPAATATIQPTPTPARPVLALGDSVMVGAVNQLEGAIPGIQINAAESRQVSAGIGLLQASRAAGRLPPVVVVHLGTNGTFSVRQFNQIMQILAGAQRVVFVNDRVPRPWEGPNNAVLAQGVKRYPNSVLLDWRAASAAHPEYFWGDGIHLRPGGAAAYAELIAAAVKSP